MTKENYQKMTQPFRDNPEMAKGIHIANKVCTGIMYLSYPLLLAYLFWKNDEMLLWAVLVPASSFVLLSGFRHLIDRKRPYEKFETAPVIPKDTKGRSFPSRHVFSAAMIAMSYLCLFPWSWVGILFLAVTVLLAVIRVVSGVHYISDVVAGMAVAFLAAWIGYM